MPAPSLSTDASAVTAGTDFDGLVGENLNTRAGSGVSLENTDPTTAPIYGDGWLSRWCKKALYEPRDEVFVRLTLSMIALMTALMGGLYAVLRYTHVPPLAASAAYLALWGWYLPPVILMLHCTMHRPFLRKPKILDRAHPFVMSFFFGIPTGYREHHLGIHHFEDNAPEDLSSTRAYRRDSFLQFLVYFARLFFLAIVEVPKYLFQRRRYVMARRALVSELLHIAIIALVVWRAPWFGVTAFCIPYFICRFMMMAGNWGQHAFLNDARENDGISNAITCINSPYNKRCFNDGYHIGHHLKASRHWTELPGDFMQNRDAYAESGALVFEGIDFFQVSFFLWTGRWRSLARRLVRLDGKEKSDDEVIAMLKERVKPCVES
jgi:fatty acid desaturase